MHEFRIGDLARLGGVSVRMLRHYHELGLLVPARIDADTGYRFYQRDQLATLTDIVHLRRLGLSLADVAIVVGGAEVAQVRQILASQRDALVEEAALASANIERLDAFIGDLDRRAAGENQDEERSTTTNQPGAMTMSQTQTIEVECKPIPARLVAQLSAVAESWEPTDIGPVIQPLYPELLARMKTAGVAPAGPSTAWYEDTDEGRIHVHATMTIAERPEGSPAELGFEVLELPAVSLAATTIHRGSMDDADRTYLALLEWLEENGHTPVGYSRELDIECGPDQEWVTELQQPIEQ